MCTRATVMQIHDEDGKRCGERDHGHGGHVVLPCGTESIVSPKQEMKTVELPICLLITRRRPAPFKHSEGNDVEVKFSPLLIPIRDLMRSAT